MPLHADSVAGCVLQPFWDQRGFSTFEPLLSEMLSRSVSALVGACVRHCACVTVRAHVSVCVCVRVSLSLSLSPSLSLSFCPGTWRRRIVQLITSSPNSRKAETAFQKGSG